MMDAKTGEPAHQEYLVIQTLEGLMPSFRRIGLDIPNRELVQEIETKLIEQLELVFDNHPHVDIEAIPFSTFSDEIMALADKVMEQSSNLIAISTSPLIASGTDGLCFQLNRISDFSENIIGIGPRPGHPSLIRQLNAMKKRIGNKSVVIIEDGSFSGSSIIHMLDMFRQATIRVEAIVLGVLFPEARKAFDQKFHGRLLCYRELENPLDWLLSHDFIPYMPNGGRVLGGKMGHSIFPTYLHNGASIAMPYIYPYGKPVEWACLPDNRERLNIFSANCIRLAIKIFSTMETIGGNPVFIKDVLRSKPRTNIAVSATQYDFVDSGEQITKVLRGDIEYLN